MSHCVCSVAHTRIRRRVGHRVSVVGFFLLSPLSVYHSLDMTLSVAEVISSAKIQTKP